MEKAKIVHEFDCDQDTLWDVCLFDDVYSTKLYHDTLAFPKWRVLEHRTTGDQFVRRLEIQPPVTNVPGPVKKVIGEQLGYVEEGTFDRKTHRYSYHMTPTTLAERTRITGVMWTEPRGENRCARTVEFEIDVHMMIVGKIIEQRTVEDTRATHEKIAAFTRQYLLDRAGK